VLPAGIREVRARADAGFYHDGFLSALENCSIQYTVVAKIYPPLKRLLPGITYHPSMLNGRWESVIIGCSHGPKAVATCLPDD
jgi:hypothetical protein